MNAKRKIPVREIIKKVIYGEDYRVLVQDLINSEFLDYSINFFKKIVDAKTNNQDITIDWYKKYFVMNKDESPDNRAIYAGMNRKTISNSYGTAKKEVVIEVSEMSYDNLVKQIDALTISHQDLDMQISLVLHESSVQLNFNEALIVINSLAVKRAAIRGGVQSASGKNVEGPLMIALCKLFAVADSNYEIEIPGGGQSKYGNYAREIDFFLRNNNKVFKCEVKLMGKGNPESADAIIARETNVFVADTLSETNKRQCDSLNVYWVELRAKNGFMRFANVLENLNIPHIKPNLNELGSKLDEVLDEIDY